MIFGTSFTSPIHFYDRKLNKSLKVKAKQFIQQDFDFEVYLTFNKIDKRDIAVVQEPLHLRQKQNVVVYYTVQFDSLHCKKNTVTLQADAGHQVKV